MNMKTLATALLALLITSCGTIKPETVTNAVIAHQTFPSFAMAVQECIADRPDVQDAIRPAWNRTFDKWVMAKDIEPNLDMLVTVASFPREFAEAETDALFIEQTIVNAGLDCGPYVRQQWGDTKVTFVEFKTAIASNERIVRAIQWADLLANFAVGRGGKMVRM